MYDYINIKEGHKFLSILPVWHSFERAVEYIILNAGGTLAYSKPIGAIMIPDMAQVQPQWMASVPRIWEGVRASIFRTINKEGGAKKALLLSLSVPVHPGFIFTICLPDDFLILDGD